MYLRIILVSLILLIFNVYAHNNNQENDDDFIDIGVRLTGDNHDTLIADLIAEEKDLLNAGHVSCKIIEIEYVLFSNKIDQWNWYVSFSYSKTTWSTIKTCNRSNN